MKRYLTNDEISFIISDIKPITGLDKAISENIYVKFREKMIEMLKRSKVYPDVVDGIKKKLTYHYYNSQATAGESIGILTAQSIGERQTQLALDSFHSTGITTVTVVTGVPRFNELVNASKKPKNVLTTIYLNEDYKTIEDIRDNAGIFIKHMIFKDVVNSSIIKQRCKQMDYWYSAFGVLQPVVMNNLDNQYTHYIRCQCDLETLFLCKLRLEHIAKIINEAYDDILCVWSPDIIGILDIWINTDIIEVPKHSYINEMNKVCIYAEDIIIPTLNELTIGGVEGIKYLNYTQKPQTDYWIIDAMGFNLKQLLTMDIIDTTRTVSNHMWELHDILGIEATREFLINEFVNVISLDSYINIRHVQLLVDVMLYTGSISSISRYGVHKNQSGALTKCSFEESLDQILKAGIYGEKELINGVSGAIICGKVSNVGTGLCDLIYNAD